MKGYKSLILGLILVIPNSSQAFRCGRELVEIGDLKEDVEAICGEPYSAETHTEIVGSSYNTDARLYGNNNGQFPNSSMGAGVQNFRQIQITVDEWVYDFGRTRMRQFLRFENGRVREIRNLSRGGSR